MGCVTDLENQTGCSVVLPPLGTVGGIAIRGGAPGTREAAALGPNGTVEQCHGVVLCGSSLFGLAVADGVAEWCAARGRGLQLHAGTFPIIGAAVVLDLRSANTRRLDRRAGIAACEAASYCDPKMGTVGVGTGCTVGKEAGSQWSSKGGQGWSIQRRGALTVSALMAVNALGSIYRPDGEILAGCRAPADHPRFPDTAPISGLNAAPPVSDAVDEAGSLSNTVIGCIVTNARASKPHVCRIADLGHTGIARTVSPAHTSLDGDALFALATGEIEATLDLVADMAAKAVAAAIRAGVRAAEGLPGRPADPRASQAER